MIRWCKKDAYCSGLYVISDREICCARTDAQLRSAHHLCRGRCSLREWWLKAFQDCFVSLSDSLLYGVLSSHLVHAEGSITSVWHQPKCTFHLYFFMLCRHLGTALVVYRVILNPLITHGLQISDSYGLVGCLSFSPNRLRSSVLAIPPTQNPWRICDVNTVPGYQNSWRQQFSRLSSLASSPQKSNGNDQVRNRRRCCRQTAPGSAESGQGREVQVRLLQGKLEGVFGYESVPGGPQGLGSPARVQAMGIQAG
jgi:hypothetical protein